MRSIQADDGGARSDGRHTAKLDREVPNGEALKYD